MQRIENPDVGLSCSIEDLFHVRNALVGFSNTSHQIPQFAALGNEIVVRVDHHQASEVLVIRHVVIFPLRRGQRDCISDLQDEYRGDLTVDAWGAETVSRKLREHRGLVAAVFSDAWADAWCGTAQVKSAEKREKRKRYVDDVLRAAMSVQFGKDNDVRFRQVDLTGISVESLFVDVPASSHPGSPADRLLKEMNPPQQAGPGDTAVSHAGAAQALLHPSWTDSTVIVGGPGQGKTTLLQYLCQYHRARCLGRDEYSPIAAGLAPVTRVDRTPIKIELTEYAAWRRKRLGAVTRGRTTPHSRILTRRC